MDTVFQRINKMYQVNVAKIEKEMLAYCLKGMKMIKLSNGVEISEDTVISALKKAGINVEPKHVWEAGDVAYIYGDKSPSCWRLIVLINGKLYSINQLGYKQGNGTQEYFGRSGYKFVGKQKNILKQ